MNDPHVVALLYRIEHGRSVDYGKAKDHERPVFVSRSRRASAL